MSTSTRSPSVTVVLPTHDRPRLLAEAIASVRAQTWENWDLIVVDDASDPPASIPDDPRCALIRNVRSRGGAEAKNAGAFQARGDVLATGWVDAVRQMHPGVAGPYAWWSWRGKAFDNDAGWRIDYHLVTPGLAARVVSAGTERPAAYALRWSDHAPVTVEFGMKR